MPSLGPALVALGLGLSLAIPATACADGDAAPADPAAAASPGPSGEHGSAAPPMSLPADPAARRAVLARADLVVVPEGGGTFAVDLLCQQAALRLGVVLVMDPSARGKEVWLATSGRLSFPALVEVVRLAGIELALREVEGCCFLVALPLGAVGAQAGMWAPPRRLVVVGGPDLPSGDAPPAARLPGEED